MAVDASGNVYVTGEGDNRVWKLAAGAEYPAPLPFTNKTDPVSAAVDPAGNLYITDFNHHQVLKLTAGAANPGPAAAGRRPSPGRCRG